MTIGKTLILHPKPGTAFGMAVMEYLIQCSKCKRKILVEMPMIGVPHHTGISAMCGECLVVADSFKSVYPEQAKEIEEWLAEKP